MCDNHVKLPTDHDFRKLRDFGEELESQWEQINSFALKNSQLGNRNFSSNPISGYESTAKNTPMSIEQIALAQIQHEFLAIRMVAYKMYEKYNEHSHLQLWQQLQVLKGEQNKLIKQITELKQIKTNLLDEERKLQKQLTQIKKINQLVGRRYFIDNSRLQTNFTTN